MFNNRTCKIQWPQDTMFGCAEATRNSMYEQIVALIYRVDDYTSILTLLCHVLFKMVNCMVLQKSGVWKRLQIDQRRMEGLIKTSV